LSIEEGSRGVLVGRVFLSRAFDDESTRELSRVLRQLAEARREAGHPVLCWLLVDPETDVPKPAARAAMLQVTTSMLTHCESLTLIVVGDGLRQTLLRTALRGMTTLGRHTLRARVVDSLEAAARMAGAPPVDMAALEHAARSAGILSAPPADVAESRSL
jgi:hypothetical protein